MAKLTLKRLKKLLKQADMVYQDQKNENVFHFVDSRQFYLNPITKKPRINVA